LSRRISSATLQQILEIISQGNCAAPDALFSTAMFGTGVDVPRLSLMIMHGQPKTTSSYIQATGRVGRAVGGLVLNFYRATRPRDLSHYEYFTSYHLALHKYVEPPSVNPYSERAIEVAGGPVYVAIARNSSSIDLIDNKSAASNKVKNRDPSFIEPLEFIEKRVKTINGILGTGLLDSDEIRKTFESLVDRWVSIAIQYSSELVFSESPYASPRKPVVLGDLAHELGKYSVVYQDVPQSLRGIEHMFEINLR
ncbi:MAG: helicase-related protein, partial [Nitrososphaeria archaeon]